MLKRIARTAVLAATLTFAGAAGCAQAGVIQLGFILDSSGSIAASNWSIITGSLSSAINALVPTNGTYEISVVSFSTGASTVVDHVLIDSAATRNLVATEISTAPFLAGYTRMDLAFNAMQTALMSSPMFDANGMSYVNIATDGVPEGPLGTGDISAKTITAVSNIIAAGVDNISVEGIGASVDPSYLQTSICYPQTCDTTSPYNFPTQGFYIPLADAGAYANAIQNKIRVVTNQVPEPATLGLVGFGLLGAGFLRRKSKKRAA